jgi:hypothetical protein
MTWFNKHVITCNIINYYHANTRAFIEIIYEDNGDLRFPSNAAEVIFFFAPIGNNLTWFMTGSIFLTSVLFNRELQKTRRYCTAVPVM